MEQVNASTNKFYLGYMHYDDSSQIWVIDRQFNLGANLFNGYAGACCGFQQTDEWKAILVTKQTNASGTLFTVFRLSFNPDNWLDDPVVDAWTSIENPHFTGDLTFFVFGIQRMVSLSVSPNWNAVNPYWWCLLPNGDVSIESYLNTATGLADSTHSAIGFTSTVVRIGGSIPIAVTVTARDGWGDLCTPGETVRVYLDSLTPEPTQEDGALALTYEGPFRDVNGVPLATSVNTVLDENSQAVVYYHPPRTGSLREEIVHAESPG